MLDEGGIARWLPDEAKAPLQELTVGELLDRSASRFGPREAVVLSAFEDLGFNARLTYDDLAERSDLVAKGLIALGLREGARTAVWSSSVSEWIILEFAVAKAGLTLVTVNPTYKADELAYVLGDSGAEVLFFLPRIRHLRLVDHVRMIRGSLSSLRHVFTLGDYEDDFDSMATLLELGGGVSNAELAERKSSVNPRAVAQIQYTSGTTGRPKGAMLTHFSIVNNARLTSERWGLGPEDRWCNPLPLFHTAGCVMATLSTISTGACQLPQVWFDPLRTLETIESERATILHGAPTMLIGVLAAYRDHPVNVSTLRLVGSGGAPTPVDLGRRIREQWGLTLRIVYGLTETSPLITVVPVDAPYTLSTSTTGPPLPETEVLLVSDTGDPAALGEPGELCTRGYLLMQGYLDKPEATASVIDDEGWFHTGDLATMDENGYITIVGRSKDVIIRGGENIYPAEVEDWLCRHPKIVEAAVVGVPDPYYGEEACAVVRTRAELEAREIQGWLRARISHQKVPRYIVTVDAYPLTESGKIQKFRLRAEMAAVLGLA